MIFFFFSLLIAAIRLLGSGTTEENKENDLRPPLPQSYAATVAIPSTSSASTVPGEQMWGHVSNRGPLPHFTVTRGCRGHRKSLQTQVPEPGRHGGTCSSP